MRRRALAATVVAVATLGLTTAADDGGPTVAAACTISTTLRIGAAGPAVVCVQSSLAAAGFSPGPVDGAFGPVTSRAVVAFQRARGLYVDGVVGPQTAGALDIWGATSPPPSPPPPAPSSCAISSTLRVGSSGVQVQCLQSRLAALGRSPGPIDGAFGAMTASAVRSFQRAAGVYVDGVVGPQTGAALGILASSPGSGGACAAPGDVPAAARQVVVVTSSGSAAVVGVLTRTGSEWSCTLRGLSARVGRNGVRPLLQRRSGDGTTPGGVFALGAMTAPDGQTFQFFGNGANPGVHGAWRQVRSGDCWGATPGTADYNQLVTRT